MAAATFLGAFLLFFLEPLIARFLLPWFGGSAGVWTTCLLFFQVCLLAGYAYAHALSRWLSPRVQIAVHLVLVACAVLVLPVTPGPEWKPPPTAAPVPHLLRLLTTCIGLPFLVLSATGPLLQAWFSRLRPGRSPYRLYALSNAGSLLALLSHPFLFEPWLPRTTQATGWGWGFGLYALMNLAVGLAVWRSSAVRVARGERAVEPGAASRDVIPGVNRLLWLALPACAALLLMAVTNKLCEDLASIPFLWVLPLSLYLITFILCFDSPVWYQRRALHAALWIWLPFLAYALLAYESIPWPAQVALYSFGLFVTCMICHGELYRLRPAPEHLTPFYLMIAAGGALGGGFVAVGAPALFDSYAELHVGVLLVVVLLVVIHAREQLGFRWKGRRVPLWPLTLAGALFLTVLLSALGWGDRYRAVERHRDFYGVFRILEMERDNPLLHARVFMSGGTIHGAQYEHPVKAAWPTTYFARGSGVGVVLDHLPSSAPRRIGVVGLGVGTLAAYGRPGDVLRFYELVPYVAEVARTRFTYLAQSRAQIEVALGDARLSLERELPQEFDVLVLDAFSSDAIPVHLLTREAFEIYRRHLKPGGVLAAHVSNRHLDLAPVVKRLARDWGVPAAETRYRPGPDRPEATPSYWMILTENPTLLALPGLRFSHPGEDAGLETGALWTDDHVSLFPQLSYGSSRDGAGWRP